MHEMCPRIPPRCAEIAMNRNRPMKPRIIFDASFHRWWRWITIVDKATCHLRCHRSLHLKPFWRTSLDEDLVDPSPRDGHLAILSNAYDAATCPAKTKTRGNLVPYGIKNRKSRIYKLGRRNAFALPPQLSNQAPLTSGPFTFQPPYHVAPPGHPLGLAWPMPRVRATLHRMGSRGFARWPCVPRRTRAGLVRHVNSTHYHTPHQLRVVCGK